MKNMNEEFRSNLDQDELNPLELREALAQFEEKKPRTVGAKTTGSVSTPTDSINLGSESATGVTESIHGALGAVSGPTLADGERADNAATLSEGTHATTSPLAFEEVRPFFQAREFKGPAYVLQKEEPQHRLICYLAAQGNTNLEIAGITGFSPVTIAYVKKQPWAQLEIAKIQQEQGGKVVREMFQGAAKDVAQALINIATDKVPSQVHDSAVRVKAANDILNRLYGKAPETIRHESLEAGEMSNEELEAIILAGKN